MTDADRDAEARRWLHYAREDLRAAELLLNQDTPAPNQSCWHAQQAAEKSLKGSLVFFQIDFRKTHDLDILRNLLPEELEMRRSLPDLAELTEWAVEARYPGDWPEATAADARAAVEQANTV